MPFFVYRAADRRGQTIDGVMEATDARSVVERHGGEIGIESRTGETLLRVRLPARASSPPT